ncbi:MAG: glycogen/starch/alpha-glucan phosphorylase [Clostridia bacterium]|nr:glycogen/starch/alpha-glucan phosphorylase [Clostridia bacterium]
MGDFIQNIDTYLALSCGKTGKEASDKELYEAISKAAMAEIYPLWGKDGQKRACYFSAEFLIGRMIESNLYNLGLLSFAKEYLSECGRAERFFEKINDAALGNGGLGRLAACFLDSAATQGVRLDGYGIRYRFGLFRQEMENGWQKEAEDDWESEYDPWSIRKEEERELIRLGDQWVYAVPYDMPVIGYKPGEKAAIVNTLRLWQAEPVHPFDFHLFNEQQYEEAMKERVLAESISAVLYPNDSTERGKRLRLSQQYFFVSASLASIYKEYRKAHGSDFSQFDKQYAIQLNDTHPTVAIPELLRLLCEDGVPFDEAFSICHKTFAYTNHTIMAEALEKWDENLFLSVLPQVYPYVVMLNLKLRQELLTKGVSKEEMRNYLILDGGVVHMARMAIYVCHQTNGVAQIHTEILKTRALSDWNRLYPERIINETNGITQRRWLGLANPELSSFVTERIGEGWLTNLEALKGLEKEIDNPETLAEFIKIKNQKKSQLAQFIEHNEGIKIDPSFVFDVQIKRLHEYKRQLLNAFSILDIYYGLLEGRITDFAPTVFIFGAKAAPGYRRAKAIIKYINELAKMISQDERMNGLLKVIFVQNYNVSYAEKLIPAADISEQISTAGTEASGTSNMKFMLNGAVTLGTFDGANVEIVREAGEENNYIFGNRVEDIEKLSTNYQPKRLYETESRIKRVLDSLIDGTFSDDGSGEFRELYESILFGANWHAPDHYYLLADFLSYCEAKLKANHDWKDREAFAKKCLKNIANSGKFSSDRTISGYAKDIWKLK